MELTRAVITLIREITALLPVITLNHFPPGEPTNGLSSHWFLLEVLLAAATQSWTFCWNVAGLIVLKTGGAVFFYLKSDNSRELEVKFILCSLQV